ncbi:MAG: arginine repressor [Actinomycetota bacterium]|nr:arginine repressor [Actinomycetota bacterium]
MKSQRRRDLLKILHEGRAATQQEFVAALRAAGHDVTQATVSRDLHELGAVKVRVGDRVAYRFPDDVPRLRPQQRTLLNELAEFAIDIRTAATLVIVVTVPGHASAVARSVDLANEPGVRGTIAGDDTIFVATPDEHTAEALATAWGRAADQEGEVAHGV